LNPRYIIVTVKPIKKRSSKPLPMKRNSTIVYAMNDFEKKAINLFDAEELITSGKVSANYPEVVNALDKALVSPRAGLIQNILNIAKKA